MQLFRINLHNLRKQLIKIIKLKNLIKCVTRKKKQNCNVSGFDRSTEKEHVLKKAKMSSSRLNNRLNHIFSSIQHTIKLRT